MEIRNIYSSYDNYGYEDERLYSVLMDEDEVALFSCYLEQREYVSKRKSKKLAKKVLEAEQEFRDAGMTEAANEAYSTKMRKLMEQTDAHKIIDYNPSTGNAVINPIKNDRAAEQIAGAIGNGNEGVKAEIAEKLKKSKGGKGVDVQQHISAGHYSPEGVKQGVVRQKTHKSVERSRRNGDRVRIKELEAQVQNQRLAEEARLRSLEAKHQRELEKLLRSQATRAKAVSQESEKVLDSAFKRFLKNHKKAIIGTSVGLAATGAGLGAYALHKKRKNKGEYEEQ